MRSDGQKGWEERRDVVVYHEVVGWGRLVWDPRLGVEEVGFVGLVEVIAVEEGTRAKDEMVPMGLGLGLEAGLQECCWRAIAMDVLESRGQEPEPAVGKSGWMATREDVPAQEAALA